MSTRHKVVGISFCNKGTSKSKRMKMLKTSQLDKNNQAFIETWTKKFIPVYIVEFYYLIIILTLWTCFWLFRMTNVSNYTTCRAGYLQGNNLLFHCNWGIEMNLCDSETWFITRDCLATKMILYVTSKQ